MTTPLISTKLHIPRLPRALVSRSRLTDRLGTGLQGKLILVSAPAGFGKTTLIAEWANRRREENLVSWVHLDESDNEPLRFLSYIIAALQNHREGIGEAALSGLQSVPPAPVEAALTSLVNEIDLLERDLILTLDDYHAIDNASIHEAVGFLIEHLPEQMCLVIATRTDPPLPVHRMRARGQMLEIRVEDLRFSNDETRTFLQEMLNLPISVSDIAALDKRVEGWVAGLQMVALSLRGRQDISQFIETFSASHRYIMDYLTEEIYNQQPPHIQKFLLQTSVLDRLSGSLCDFMVGADFAAQDVREEFPSAQQMLEYLERANLFLLPMDDERHWYRYHHLFASLLRQRLRQTRLEEIPVYLRRASTWSAANGYIEEAVKYALAADDIQAAAQLVENHAMDLLKAGALVILSGWLSKFPEEIILGRPWLSVYFGWALLLSGKLEDIERYLLGAEEARISPGDSDDLRGHITAMRAYISAMQGKADQAVRQANEALKLLPEDELSVRCVVVFVLGGVYYMQQDFPHALEAMEKAARMGEKAGNPHLAVSALSAAGDILRIQGKLSEAEQVYGRALKLGTSHGGRPLPIAARVYSSQAELYLARNDLEKARQFALTGVELAGQWGNVDSLAGSYLALAQIERREGNSVEAQLALDEVKLLDATYSLSPGFADRIAAFEALGTQGRTTRVDQGFLIDPLTDRELEVLRLIAQGRSNPEIAAELIIALGTVKAHTSSIYRKLDARSRTEAVIKAGERGLL